MTLIEEARAIAAMPSPEDARQLRLSAGIGLARMADAVGVSRVTLAAWESGERRPRGEHRLQYARTLAELAAVLRDAA